MRSHTSRWKVTQVLELDHPRVDATVTLTIERDWPIWRWFFKPRVTVTMGDKVCRGVLRHGRAHFAGSYFDLGTFSLEVMPADSAHATRWLRCLVTLDDDASKGPPMSTGTWTADEDGP